MAHCSLPLRRGARHDVVAVGNQPQPRTLSSKPHCFKGQWQDDESVLHGGAELGILQLQCRHRGQDSGQCRRCLAHTAAETHKRPLASVSGGVEGLQQRVVLVLGHLPAETALRTCDG
jgi:hypothetical protein